MADEPTVPGETPKPTTPGETPAATDNKPTLEESLAELASAKARIAELNKESAKHRKEAEALTKAKADKEAAEMTELQKLQAKADQAEKAKADTEARLTQTLIRSAIVEKASALNFADPTDAVALLDKSKLTVNEDGTVEGTDAALKELLKVKPHLAKRPTPSGAATNPGASGVQGETVEQQRARVYGTGQNPFDPANALRMGGGVSGVSAKSDKG